MRLYGVAVERTAVAIQGSGFGFVGQASSTGQTDNSSTRLSSSLPADHLGPLLGRNHTRLYAGQDVGDGILHAQTTSPERLGKSIRRQPHTTCTGVQAQHHLIANLASLLVAACGTPQGGVKAEKHRLAPCILCTRGVPTISLTASDRR